MMASKSDLRSWTFADIFRYAFYTGSIKGVDDHLHPLYPNVFQIFMPPTMLFIKLTFRIGSMRIKMMGDLGFHRTSPAITFPGDSNAIILNHRTSKLLCEKYARSGESALENVKDQAQSLSNLHRLATTARRMTSSLNLRKTLR